MTSRPAPYVRGPGSDYPMVLMDADAWRLRVSGTTALTTWNDMAGLLVSRFAANGLPDQAIICNRLRCIIARHSSIYTG